MEYVCDELFKMEKKELLGYEKSMFMPMSPLERCIPLWNKSYIFKEVGEKKISFNAMAKEFLKRSREADDELDRWFWENE